MRELETDYLVVGAGASALAFVDTLIDVCDAEVILVDRCDMVGGHWNDAYPFVRLHQPSSYYGVASLPLGRGRIDASGLNAGFEELATGPEVTAYLHRVLAERLLPSGRVRFLPLCDHVGGGTVRHLLSGRTERIGIRRRLVDARLCENTIPATHARGFDVAPGVACIPPNHLPRMAPGHDRFTVLGGGKTGMDSVLWLLERGVAPDRIRWVVPRDPWIVNRAVTQPSGAFYGASFGGHAAQLEALAAARSPEDLALRLEEAGIWMRLDSDVMPGIVHGATLAPRELELLRTVSDVVRAGRVQSLAPDRMQLQQGERRVAPGTLHVDCTASALSHATTAPVFTADRIALQMIRIFQPTFSTALIARIEALDLGDRARNALAAPLAMPDTVASWVAQQMGSMMNHGACMEVPELKRWSRTCRLDGFGRPGREVDRADPYVARIYERIRAATLPALANMTRLISA